ncbi:hypothetical protein Q9299_02620 [Gemmobacter fulvus]|uniref:hypothetical protein n=1 Tax=Gemmobacter fulvus TaxID=2840474 RepID=UPI002796A1DB|nr:hypothetical protein [Gemmobacter fulvus]MDQ1847171.1 hypothetical protein [Gemmobacter fulvus]
MEILLMLIGLPLALVGMSLGGDDDDRDDAPEADAERSAAGDGAAEAELAEEAEADVPPDAGNWPEAEGGADMLFAEDGEVAQAEDVPPDSDWPEAGAEQGTEHDASGAEPQVVDYLQTPGEAVTISDFRGDTDLLDLNGLSDPAAGAEDPVWQASGDGQSTEIMMEGRVAVILEGVKAADFQADWLRG